MFDDFDVKKTTKEIIKFLQHETKKAGFKKIIVPLSGGIDSSTVVYLAVQALGPENVLIAKLPHKELNQDHDADLVIAQLKIPKENIFEIEISGIVESFLRAIPGIERPKFRELSLERIRLGNLMARIRMVILFDLAKKNHCLVCGTENKSEYLLGYFTRFGDEASDLEPVRHLYKTQLVQLAKYLGVPAKIIKKTPTAGLWKGQTDENELGFFYEQADPILFSHFDQKLSWGEIKKNYPSVDSNIVEKIKKRVESNIFKHEVPKLVVE